MSKKLGTDIYLFITIVELFINASCWNLRGIGEDCVPIWRHDGYLINQLSISEEFIDDFRNGTKLEKIQSKRWTRDLESKYVELILQFETTCNVMELLDCSLKWNTNSDLGRKHHHHKNGTKTKGLHGESILEDRNGMLIVENDKTKVVEKIPETEFQSVVLEYDPRLEGRCTCNEDYSMHHKTKVIRNGVKQYNHKCLGLIGTPCAYEPHLMDFSYLPYGSPVFNKFPNIKRNPLTCVPGAKCLSIEDRIHWDKIHKVPVEPIHRDDDIQEIIEDTLGYQLIFQGYRPAYLNYLLKYATHLCLCQLGYKQIGNKECVKDEEIEIASEPVPQIRSVEGGESGSELGKSLPVKAIGVLVLTIVKYQIH